LNEGNKVTNETLNLPKVDQSQRGSIKSSCSAYEEVNNMIVANDERDLHESFSDIPKSSVLNKVVDEQTSSSCSSLTSSLSMNIEGIVPISHNRLNSDQLENNVLVEGI
jgi:hypothetical protein